MAEDNNIQWEALGEVDDSITILEGLLWEKFAPGQVANVGRVDYRVKGTIDDADFTAAELKVQSALKSFGVKLDSEGMPEDIPNTPSGKKRALEILAKVLSKDQKLFNALQAHGAVRSASAKMVAAPSAASARGARSSIADKARARIQRRFVASAVKARRQGDFSKAYAEYEKLTGSKTVTDEKGIIGPAGKTYPAAVRIGGFGGPLDVIVEGILSERAGEGKSSPLRNAFSELGFGSGGKRTGLAGQISHIYEKDPELAMSILMAAIVPPGSKGAIKIDSKTGKINVSGEIFSPAEIKKRSNDFAQIAKILATGKIGDQKIILAGSPTEKIVQAFLAYANANPKSMLDRETRIKLALKEVKAGKYQSGDVSRATKPASDKELFVDTTGKNPELYRWNKTTKSWVPLGAAPIQISRVIKGDQVLIDPKAADELKKLFSSAERSISGSKAGKELVKILKDLGRRGGEIDVLAEGRLAEEGMRRVRKAERFSAKREKAAGIQAIKDAAEINLSEILGGINQTKFGKSIPKRGLTKAFIVSTIGKITSARIRVQERLRKDRLEDMGRKGRLDDEREYARLLAVERSIIGAYQGLRSLPSSIRREIPALSTKGGKVERLPKLGMGKKKIINDPKAIYRGMSPTEKQEEYRLKREATEKLIAPHIKESKRLAKDLATIFGVAAGKKSYEGVLSAAEKAALRYSEIQSQVKSMTGVPLEGRQLAMLKGIVRTDQGGVFTSNIRAGVINHINVKNSAIIKLLNDGSLFDVNGKVTAQGKFAIDDLMETIKRYRPVMQVIGYGEAKIIVDGQAKIIDVTSKGLDAHERLERFADIVFQRGGVISLAQLRELGATPSTAGNIIFKNLQGQGKTSQEALEAVAQAEAASKMDPDKVLKRLFAVSGEDSAGRAAKMELMGFLRKTLGTKVDPGAVDQERIDSLLSSLGISKGGKLNFKAIGSKGQGTLTDIFKNVFPNESYSKGMLENWFETMAKDGVRQLRATPGSAISGLVARPLGPEEVKAEVERMREQAKLAKAEEKAANATAKTSRSTRASGKLGTAAGVNDQGVPVDEKGRPFLVGAKGDRFAAPGQGKPPSGISGLGKYLVKQGLISSEDQLVMQPKARGKKQGIDVAATAAAAKLGDAGTAMLSMVNAARARGMRFDPESRAPLAQGGASDLYGMMHGGTKFTGPKLTPLQKKSLMAATDAAMQSGDIRSGKSGMTAAEWLASQKARAKVPSEKVLRKSFLKKFGSDETLKAIGSKAGIDLSPESVANARSQFDAARASAAARRSLLKDVRKQQAARAKWQEKSAARFAAGKSPIDFGGQSPLPNRAAGILPTRAPIRGAAPAAATKAVAEAAVGTVQAVASQAAGGRIPNIDMGSVGSMLEHIGKIKAPNIANLQKVVEALAKVQEILNTASGIRGGIAGKLQGGAARAPGGRLYNATKGTGRPFRFLDAEQAQYQKAASEYDAARKKALATSVDQIKSGALLGRTLPGVVKGGQKTTVGSELDRMQSEIFKGLESRALSRAQRSVRAGRPATGYATDAQGGLSLGPEMALRMQERARAAAVSRMAQQYPKQLASMQTEIIREARTAFRTATAPARSAAAQRAVVYDRSGGGARPPGYASRPGGFGGGGGGFGRPPMGPAGFGRGGMGGGFGGTIPGPQIGTDGVQKFANDAMGILGNLQQQIKFGFSQEITREISQALGGVLAHFKDGIIKFNQTLETSTVAFQTLFENQQKLKGEDIDVGKATKDSEFMVSSIQSFANLTPFRFPELVEAARKMQAFGFETKEILPNLQAIGDAVAALGGEDDKIRRITYALGQMRSAGRVYQNDMMQLANAGIAGYDILSRALLQDFVKTGDIVLEYNGKTIDRAYVQTTEGQADLVTATVKATDDATRGQVKLASSSSAEIAEIFKRISLDPIEAIRDLTSSGKIGEGAAEAIIDGLSQSYGGGMKKLAKTFEGGMSTLADVSQYFVAQVSRPLFELTRDVVIDLGLFFQSRMAQRAVTKFAGAFALMIPPVEKTFRDVVDISSNGVSGIIGVIGSLGGRLDAGGGMSFLDRFGDGIAIVADIMRTDLAKAIFGTILVVKALSLAVGLNPMAALIGGIIVGISAIKQFTDATGDSEISRTFGSMILAFDSMKRTFAPMLERIAATLSSAFGATFIAMIRVAVPVLQKVLNIMNAILQVFTSLPLMSEALGLAATYALLRRMILPLNKMILGSPSTIDPRTGMAVPGGLGIGGTIDQGLRNTSSNLYAAAGGGRGGVVARALGFGPTAFEANPMTLARNRFAAMEARGFFPAGGAARASAAHRGVLADAVQRRGLQGARDVLGNTTNTRGGSVALRAGLKAGNFGATGDDILTRRMISLKESISQLFGTALQSFTGRISEYYKRFRFGGKASTLMPKQLLLGPGNLQLPAGPINAQTLLPRPNIAGLLPASAESLGLRLPDTSPIRPIAKMTLVERMFKASERYAEAVIRAHRPLIALANRIESIPGVLRSMADSIYHGIGRGIIKTTRAIVYGPGNLAESMVNSMRRLGSRVFHAMGRATISATKAIVYGPGNVGVAVIDSMQKLGARVLDSVATRAIPGVGNFAERGAGPLTKRMVDLNYFTKKAQGAASLPGRALDFAANRLTVQSPLISSGLGPVSMFGRFQTAVGQFAGAVKIFAAGAKTAIVAGGSSVLKNISSIGIPALLLAGLTKGKAGLSTIKNLATGGAAISAAAAKKVAIAGGQGAISLGKKALGPTGLFAGLFTAADAIGRISSGEDAARVGVESTFDLGGMLIGGSIAAAGATAVGLGGGIPLAIAGIVGSMLGMDLIGGIGNTVADSLGLRDVAGEQAGAAAVDPVDVEKSNAIRAAFADTKLTVQEINGLLDTFDVRSDDIVANMLTGDTLPTTDELLGGVSSRLSLTEEQTSSLQSVLAMVSEEMTRQNQRVAKGAGDWEAYKNAGKSAITELAIRLASMGDITSTDQLFQTIEMLAKELGIKLTNDAYGLFNGTGAAAEDAQKKVSKLQEAVDKLRASVSKWSSRLSTRIMMLFDKRMQDNLEKAKENLDATFEVIYDGTTTNVKALRDEIEAQEKKNKLLAIEKRIREATRNVEMARLSQYDASVDPLEAAARMREAEEAKTEALKEAALERKKIALEEALTSTPYLDAVDDLEEQFEAVKLKFQEGMEDILAQLEKGKITGDEAIAKIQALYGESFALVGDLDADLIVDAADFGDNFMGTWNVIIDKLKTVVDKFIKQLKRLRRAVKSLNDPGTEPEPTEPDIPFQAPNSDSSLGGRAYDNWRGHGVQITDQIKGEAANMDAASDALIKQAVKTRYIAMRKELGRMLSLGAPAGANPYNWGVIMSNALSQFSFNPLGKMGQAYNMASNMSTKSKDVEAFFKVAHIALVKGLGSYAGNIPKMASGGTIMGPGMFSVGEAGRETLQVVPGGVARVFPRRIRPISGIGAAGGGGGGINASVIINNPTVRNDQDIRKLAEEVTRAQRSLLRSSGVGRI
jgi:hypothetical protein